MEKPHGHGVDGGKINKSMDLNILAMTIQLEVDMMKRSTARKSDIKKEVLPT